MVLRLLFYFALLQVVSEGKGISDDSDLSDSEESVYSGLENEESTSDDENEKDIEQSDEEEDSSDEKDEESEVVSSKLLHIDNDQKL